MTSLTLITALVSVALVHTLPSGGALSLFANIFLSNSVSPAVSTSSEGNLRCLNGQFNEWANEMALPSPFQSRPCATARHCRSFYANNGMDVVFELACDEERLCERTNSVDECYETDGGAKICCCRTDDCVPDGASKPIEHEFPSDFTFSAATSAFQIEGSTRDGGRGASIWDIYTHKPGNVRDNATADTTCDSYRHWRRDIAMLQELGLRQYRFSISWPRLFPDGTLESKNEEGVAFYDRLIDALLAAGIEPVVTIFHWDLPQYLQDMGGFLDSGISEHFARYANFVFAHFGDRVKKWLTLNEPLSVTQYGHCGQSTTHAPGEFWKHCEWSMYVVAHHLLQCHMKAAHVYNTKYRATQQGKLGLALSGVWYFPRSDSPEDAAASERAFQFCWGWFAHPIFSAQGDYPQVMKDTIRKASLEHQMRVRSRLPEFTPEEVQQLKGSADFVGINYYMSFRVRNRSPDELTFMSAYSRSVDVGVVIDYADHWRIVNATSKWLNYVPTGLRNVLRKFTQDYNRVPILITENGAMDTLGEGLHDANRIHYLRGHMMAVNDALTKDKARILGYTVWSLMDNFEWSEGFTTKFGLYHVDFSDPQRPRTPKASAHWYRSVATTRKLSGFSPDSYA